ncbi:glycosyltransferase [Sphingomonas sp.]|uniref:glycosyltransferase family protein n=1 Tax=Sphingomonas sp. TaxID=28214 RepID=UPI001ECE9056|nr:glycosyltransferase [Sphingomonas sp.]MBX3593338.1 glycosyltransferase family 1 protein [Sphingomonas sp.]
MRLFQNSAVYPSYLPRLARLRGECASFADATEIFLNDRFGAAHFLKPVLDRKAEAFFANGDDEACQRLWAKEQGISTKASLEAILLAQIEHHKTEVFYNIDPMRYGDDFLARLPGCVRRTIAWRAAPSAGGRFFGHDLIVNNFPAILDDLRRQGARAAYFFPAHDPEMDNYAARDDREIDIVFVGTYSRHHRKRAVMLEALAALGSEFKIAMHLDRSRLTALAETPLGWLGPLRPHRRAPDIRRVSRPAVFGRELLDALSGAKIVVNGAIDMSMEDRGNMRVWEALGCRAAMISDAGRYPDGLKAGEQFESYRNADELMTKISALLVDAPRRQRIADAGYQAISTLYSKQKQWEAFMRLAS